MTVLPAYADLFGEEIVTVPEIETIGGFRRYDPEGCELLLREVTYAEERFAELVTDLGDLDDGGFVDASTHKLDPHAALVLAEALLNWTLADDDRIPLEPATGKTGSPKWRVRDSVASIRLALDALQMDES